MSAGNADCSRCVINEVRLIYGKVPIRRTYNQYDRFDRQATKI